MPSSYAFYFFRESGDSKPGTVNDGYEYPSTVLRLFPTAIPAILRGDVSNGPSGQR